MTSNAEDSIGIEEALARLRLPLGVDCDALGAADVIDLSSTMRELQQERRDYEDAKTRAKAELLNLEEAGRTSEIDRRPVLHL